MLYAQVGVFLVFATLAGISHGKLICGPKITPAPVTTPRDIIQKAVDATNKHRADHGVPPLKINEELCKASQGWANYLAKTGKFEHSGCNCGENLFKGWGGNPFTGEDAVKGWYSEEKDYNYVRSKFSMGTGHFTALVWKSTRETCIAVARNGKMTHVVAHYYPAGNVGGGFKKNVFPKIAGGGVDGRAANGSNATTADNSTGGGTKGTSGSGTDSQQTSSLMSTLLIATGLFLIYSWIF